MDLANWQGMRDGAPMVNALLRQAILAVEEVMGANGLNVVLKEAGLSRYVGSYPPNNLDTGALAKEYAMLNESIEHFYGRAGKGMLRRIGRTSFQWGIKEQAAVLGVAGVALRVMPRRARARFILTNLAKALMDTNPEVLITVGEQDDKFIVDNYSCSICHTRHSDRPCCHLFAGTLEEAIRWATGAEPVIAEALCKAKGDSMCRFEVAVN